MRVHPRVRRRPRDDGRRARRAPAPDARPRARLAPSTSASTPRSRRSTASPTIVEEARDVLIDGVRRVATEVRSSLDFQTRTGGIGRRGRTRRPGRPRHGGARLRLRPRRGRSPCPVTEALRRARPAGVDARRVTIAAGLAARRSRSHEGRQPHPGRGAAQHQRRRPQRRRRVRLLGALVVLIVLASSWAVAGRSVSDKRAAARRHAGRGRARARRRPTASPSSSASRDLRAKRVDTVTSIARSRFDWARRAARGRRARCPPASPSTAMTGTVTPTASADGGRVRPAAHARCPTRRSCCRAARTARTASPLLLSDLRRIEGVERVALSSSAKGGGSGGDCAGRTPEPSRLLADAVLQGAGGDPVGRVGRHRGGHPTSSSAPASGTGAATSSTTSTGASK